MKSKLLWLFMVSLMFTANSLLAQTIKNEPQGVLAVETLDYKFVTSIAEQIRTGTFIPADDSHDTEINPRLRHGASVIVGKGSKGRDGLADRQLAATQVPIRGSGLSFFSVGSNGTQGVPSDPTGAVGRDFYIAAYNTSFRIFNKDGTPAMAAASNATVFGSTIGDPIVFYDSAADRYVLTQFSASPNGFEVAVSQTNDPINDGWHVYSSSGFSTGAFPDYTKFAVWSDAYYVSANIAGPTVWAIDRNNMLNGSPSTIQTFAIPGGNGNPPNGFYSPHFFSVTNDDLPAPGGATFVYQQDDAYGGVAPGNDHFKLWTVDIDWVTPANSTISAATEFPVTAFNGVFDGGSFSNLTQPTGGPDIDALQSLIYNQAAFRKFPTYNSAVFGFTVDVGGGTEQAAIRWYEMRQTGDNQPWTIYQEGTYVAPDGRHAWNGSLTIDIQGNIGMGYTTMGGTSGTLITSAYTGQLTGASGTGTMDVAEQFLFTSSAGNGSLRYSDYSQLSIDPSDNKLFWFVNEVFSPGISNHVGTFQLAPDTMNDVGVISVDTPTNGALTNSETVTVTVFNFGDNAASGFDVTYQVDGGTTITEAFAGTLASATSAQHVFSTTADLSTEGNTYSILSCTTLAGDEDTGNDCVTQNVTHEFANDIGVTAITAPVSGEGLGSETVTITIENFGTAAQSGFDVNYIIDGGTPVVETVGATVNPGASISYDFATLADLSTPATYAISSSTLLAGDSVPGNDTANTSVTNSECATTSNTTSQGIGPNGGTVTTSVINVADDFVIDDVNVSMDISHTWVGDLDITLLHPDGITSVELMPNNTCGNCDDMNVTFDDAAAASITSAGSGPITGTFSPANGMLSSFNGLMTAGDWTLTITDNANGDGGSLNSWDLQLCGDMNLSIDDNTLNADLVVIHLGDNMYSIQLPTTTINDRLEMTIFNMLGQNVYRRILDNSSGNGYEHELNMQYAASGIYIIRVGTRTSATYKRIIVK